MRKLAIVLACLASFAVSTCGARRTVTSTASGQSAVSVNGTSLVFQPGATIFDALRSRPVPIIVRELDSGTEQPLYFMDRVELLNGLEVITTTPACAVTSITVLRPVQAIARWGRRGGRGAILMTSRHGLEQCRVAETT